MNLNICNSVFKKEYDKKIEQQDTVIIKIHCILDSIDLINSLIEIQLINLKMDTLILLPNPFFIESTILTENYPWVMWGSGFSTPNIMYVENKLNTSRFLGDAIYEPEFPKMPLLYKFNPTDTVNFQINLPLQITQNIVFNNSYIGGAIVYASKLRADSLAIKSNMTTIKEYNKNLYHQRFVNINPIQPLKFSDFLSKQQKVDSISSFIWKIFNKKFIYEKIN